MVGTIAFVKSDFLAVSDEKRALLAARIFPHLSKGLIFKFFSPIRKS